MANQYHPSRWLKLWLSCWWQGWPGHRRSEDVCRGDAGGGAATSFYYSLKDSFYLNAIGDQVRGGHLLPGQVNVTQEQFEDISVAAVSELWSRFGSFQRSGLMVESLPRYDRIVHLLTTLQPDAVTYGSGISADKNAVDWVGTESGMPAYPGWSSGGAAAGGAGFRGTTPTQYPTTFCPKGSDCTLQAPDHWFWMMPNTPIKSLATLIDMYHKTFGSNSVMELDFAIDRTGNIDPTHAKRYTEFGTWIRSCYGTAIARTAWSLTNTLELAWVALSRNGNGPHCDEDISRGQRIASYSVDAMVGGKWMTNWTTGSAVGHKRIAVNSLGSQSITKLRLNVSDGVELPANISMAAFRPCPAG